MTHREFALEIIDSDINRHSNKVAVEAGGLIEKPENIDWSNLTTIIKSSVRVQVLKTIRAVIDGCDTPEEANKSLDEHLQRAIRNSFPRSTSPESNLIGTVTGEVWYDEVGNKGFAKFSPEMVEELYREVEAE